MKVDFQLRGVDGVVELLKSLPPEVVSKRGGPVKTALRKGALVILEQAKLNVQAVTSNATSSGKRESTGFLLKHLIASRGKQPTGTKGERYLVRVKRAAYDGGKLGKREKAGKRVSTLKTAHLLEYGSSKQPAEPWLRPAGASKAGQAIVTIQTELVKAIDRVVKKLAKQNKVA